MSAIDDGAPESARIFSLADRRRAPLLTSADFARLEIFAFDASGAMRKALLTKLAEARIAGGERIPETIATIGSVLLYRIDGGGVERRTLALPANATPTGQFVSVVTPMGIALVGRIAGETLEAEQPDGGRLTVELIAVEFQPEAEVRRRSMPRPHDDGPGAA
jgi:regulator of nucleoside diphosphate kinase